MKTNFNDCLTRLLKDEGGYSNDPSDSGGATNFGITIADYRKYINSSGTALDVRRMTVDEAKSIYKTKYWDALGCDQLPSGVDYTAFDYGVNSGLGRPRKALQKFKSLTGTKLIDAINDERIAFLQSISAGKNAKFLKGWLARVSRVRNYSKTLAANTPVPSTSLIAKLKEFFHG
jgi:lysozyme family protein